jgi:hypothetical protein
MAQFLRPNMVEDARRDHADRLGRHASNCVLLASVTPVSIAGELIDKAITLRAAELDLRRHRSLIDS